MKKIICIVALLSLAACGDDRQSQHYAQQPVQQYQQPVQQYQQPVQPVYIEPQRNNNGTDMLVAGAIAGTAGYMIGKNSNPVQQPNTTV